MNCKGENMKIFLKATVLVCLAGCLSGCMSFELEGDGLKTPKSSHGVETVHGSLYGFEWASRNIVKSSDGLGLYRVEYHTNALYILVSTCSLGLYVPQTVEWWCQAREEDDSDEPALKPRKKK